MYFSTRNVEKLISRSTFGLARYQFSTAARIKIQSLRKLLQHNIPYVQVFDSVRNNLIKFIVNYCSQIPTKDSVIS
jgi:hypothetical protein